MAFLLLTLSSLAGICCFSCCSCVCVPYLCDIRQKKEQYWTTTVSAGMADLSIYHVGLIVVKMRSMWLWEELGLCNGLSVLQKSGRCVAQLEAGLSFCFCCSLHVKWKKVFIVACFSLAGSQDLEGLSSLDGRQWERSVKTWHNLQKLSLFLIFFPSVHKMVGQEIQPENQVFVFPGILG